jgi:ABC-type transport system substrate-binding protein/class 3 adenylate cyclase
MTTVAGERRIVTVLFADVVGSTALAEQLGPERFALLMDEVMRLMGAEVERLEGTVVQYIGDELYAVFGAPLSHEDDSERAVRAALAIQRSLSRYAGEVRDAYGIDLAARIAINTGPVVIRPESDDPYNALGDTVNVAARIQKLVEGGEIVIGRTTKSQVESCFALEDMGRQELRGVSEPVETYLVLGVLEETPLHPLYPLVGRDFELSLLEHVMDNLVDGRGGIVSVVGEPGIGKTRLLAEVRQRYRDRVRFVEGRAVSYAQSSPYWPVRDLLREWLSLGITTPEARTRLELKTELARVFGENAEASYPFLARLLGLTLEPDAAERVRELNRESLQRETFELMSELVCRIAAEGSLCLVFEDLHWADDSTLELLEELLPVTEEAAVGLVLLYRSEREHGSWRLGERARQRFPHRYREIELRPLPGDASRLLAETIAGAELPESVADLLADRAGGNPFFLEEALHDLVERGSLRRDNGRLELAVAVEQLAIPALVQGTLQARLDRLEPRARETLEIAAVAGRRFGLPLLERIVPHEQLMPALSELQRLDLVVEQRRRPAPEYAFRHGLVQEVAYASLLESTRRKLHRKVGEALEELQADAPQEAYGLLARHFTEADLPEKAVDYLLRAGDAARAIYADQEALAHYLRARTFLVRMGDDLRARETLFKIALAHHLAFDFARAEEAYDEAFCCRVEEPPPHELTERLEIAISRPDELVPGSVYSTEGILLTEHLFRGLLMVDRELGVVPAMADNFRVSSDGLEYLFRLREGARWSDGHPLTADDFAYTWRSMREQETLTAFHLEDVESARALDDRTLEVRLREPRNYFPYILASPWSFPWPRHRCEKLGDDWRQPENLVGNGPFVLAELDERHATLRANPHWTGSRGNVREIHVELGDLDADRVAAWREGRFDVIHVYERSVADCPDTVGEVIPELSTRYIGFRADREPFSSGLLRRAFAHAVDRERLLASFSSWQRPAIRGGAIPPAMAGHSPRIAPEYDLEAARRLLADAGHPEGRGLPELVLAVPSWLSPASGFAEQWEAIGARVRIVDAGKCWTIPESAHFWVSGWTADYPDPDGFFRGFFRLDLPLYLDAEIAELLEEARSLTDQGERMRLYHRLDRMLVAERVGMLPISYGRSLLARRTWVDGLWANPLSKANFDEAVVSRSAPRSA